MKTVEHTTTVAAPPRTVYGIIADTGRWPVHFEPTVHVEQLEQRLERGSGTERFRIWAVAGKEVKSWTSRRELDPEGLRVTFRQEVSQPPVAAMAGAWILRPGPDGGTALALQHSYRAVGDDPGDLAWIDEVTDRNSRTELANIKALAEAAAEREELTLSFEDTVLVDGDAEDVHAFIRHAQDWPERLPHVSRMVLREDDPGVQIMEMDTVTADGSRHTTSSVRVCLDGTPRRIVYKQTVLPPLLTAHTGVWTVAAAGDGVAVTSGHTVVIRPEAVAKVLGEGATVADAREFAHTALSGNSRITLEHAKTFAEGRRTGTPRSRA
ncbi:aromatase/cyclase [Streptomyces sp. NPDC001922]|uniref:aromatase/cyclase n=1 Tax=Streptomyces sp. NPDC001922 TaxID=3364624 RepID=UPI0036974F8A